MLIFRLLIAFLSVALLSSTAEAVVGGKSARDRNGIRRSVVRIESSHGELCSGVLVAPDVVLTAAHCVISSARYRVIATGPDFKPQEFPVVSIKRHSSFVAGTTPQTQPGADLALLKLASSIQGDSLPLPISINHSIAAGETVFLAGYGSTSYTNIGTARTLRTTSLVSLGPERSLNKVLIIADPKGMALRPGAGACLGDSGGPIFVSTDAGYAIGGITSWSGGPERSRSRSACGGITAITPVEHYAQWISQTISSLSSYR